MTNRRAIMEEVKVEEEREDRGLLGFAKSIGLSEIEVEVAKKIFERYDTDKSGKFEEEELLHLFRKFQLF